MGEQDHREPSQHVLEMQPVSEGVNQIEEGTADEPNISPNHMLRTGLNSGGLNEFEEIEEIRMNNGPNDDIFNQVGDLE